MWGGHARTLRVFCRSIPGALQEKISLCFKNSTGFLLPEPQLKVWDRRRGAFLGSEGVKGRHSPTSTPRWSESLRATFHVHGKSGSLLCSFPNHLETPHLSSQDITQLTNSLELSGVDKLKHLLIKGQHNPWISYRGAPAVCSHLSRLVWSFLCWGTARTGWEGGNDLAGSSLKSRNQD